jgi:hypothetical protein
LLRGALENEFLSLHQGHLLIQRIVNNLTVWQVLVVCVLFVMLVVSTNKTNAIFALRALLSGCYSWPCYWIILYHFFHRNIYVCACIPLHLSSSSPFSPS